MRKLFDKLIEHTHTKPKNGETKKNRNEMQNQKDQKFGTQKKPKKRNKKDRKRKVMKNGYQTL